MKALRARAKAASIKACQEAIILQQNRQYNRMRTAIRKFIEKKIKEARIKTA
jgi:uncharacterized protein (DUF305 family)